MTKRFGKEVERLEKLEQNEAHIRRILKTFPPTERETSKAVRDRLRAEGININVGAIAAFLRRIRAPQPPEPPPAEKPIRRGRRGKRTTT